jgi:hypothetical protein
VRAAAIIAAIIAVGGSAALAQDGDLGRVSAVPDGQGGVQAEAAVDVAALARNDKVKKSAWYAKPFVALKEVGKSAGTAVIENPGKTALAVASTYIIARAIDGKLDDDWDKLRGKSSRRRAPEPTSTYDFSGSNIEQVTIQSGTGNTSTQTSTPQILYIQPAPEPEAESQQ